MLNKSVNIKKSFTLIELMIAMAILIIMMGFLFQFLNSTQKLWSASNQSDIIFEQAQTFFEYLEKDLKGAIVQDEKTNPGRGIPYWISANPIEIEVDENTSDKLLVILTQTPGSNIANKDTASAAYLVAYFIDSGKLNRRIFDYVQSSPSSKNPLYFFGDSTPDITSWSYSSNETAYMLCENISSLKMDFYSTHSINAYNLPQAIKITLELTDPSIQDTNEINIRVFSKVIFLD